MVDPGFSLKREKCLWQRFLYQKSQLSLELSERVEFISKAAPVYF